MERKRKEEEEEEGGGAVDYNFTTRKHNSLTANISISAEC